MLPFQKTGVYQQTLKTTRTILEKFPRQKGGINSKLHQHLEDEMLKATTNMAKGLSKEEIHATTTTETSPENDNKPNETYLKKSAENLLGILALLDIAEQQKILSAKQRNELSSEVKALRTSLVNFSQTQKRILILSANAGQGHMSAANAIKEAIHHKYGYDYTVEVVDFMEVLSKILSRVTKKSYENATTYAPPIYKFIYESTDKNVQILKLLNQLNYPFVINKLKKFFKEQQADILVSTHPMWDYLAAEVWKKYHRNAKFINIITDSITVHNCWLLGDTDYHIVANEDTAEALRKENVEEEKIKVLGFPVKLEFLSPTNKTTFLKSQGLDPNKETILFLPTAQNTRKNQKILKHLLQIDDINIIVITGRESKNLPKFKKYAQEPNVVILGWTDQMPAFLQSCDMVITKAGGAIIMESIAAKKPMIITSMIPGQEKGNAELIKRHKLGLIATSTSTDITDNVNYIRKNYSMFARNLSKMSNPEAALNIANFIVETTGSPHTPYSDQVSTVG